MEFEHAFKNNSDVERQLRVGFVSPNLNRHPVGHFLLPLMHEYDRGLLSFSIYCENRRSVDFTQRIDDAASQWLNIQEIGHDELRATILRDEVDILVDLAGHTGTNRMLVFAKRAALIQLTWAGYVGTTGLDEMDYLITDKRQTVSQDLAFMTEQPVYMPGNYVAFEPPEYAPPPNEPPVLQLSRSTFGCFNNIDKINSKVIELWARILNSIPHSSLKFITFDLDDEDIRNRIKQDFAAHGVDGGRLQLEGKKLHNELLSAYHDIDIALDPFPYSGGLTTLEALWMGFPSLLGLTPIALLAVTV